MSHPSPVPRGRILRGAVLAFLAVASSLVGVGPGATPASAQTARTIEITGHGWGHGRGLGQYGAYGYANQGWTSAQILDHYYGGTSAGPAPAGGSVNPEVIRVELRGMRGRTTAVALGQGALIVKSMEHENLARVETGAVRLRWAANGYEVETASSCAGPWTRQTRIQGRSTLRIAAETTATGTDGLLAVCGATTRTWYQGEIRAVIHNGAPFTVNTLAVEDYLRGVVPNEMPASWPRAALEAQAVAARSYALAGDTRQQPYADTCDTVLCQVYDGAYTERGGFRASTKPTTDAAIAATAGLVRLQANGKVARTEFSSSTGGWTAGGAFPAVVDDGDAVAANPNHNWSTVIEASKIEARYNRGRLLAMEVTARNGLGADGGRVQTVRLTFEGGTVTESGATLRSFLGLKSDWYTPGPVIDASLRTTADGRWIDWAHSTLAGRPATDGEVTSWFERVRQGDRRALTGALVTSGFFGGRMVDDLYQRALGRSADPDGRAYWVGQLGRGVKLEAIGVQFFGSREYHQRAGGTDAAFVAALYRDILGRAPDPAGQAYWQGRLANRTARPDDVAAGFYVSLESRRVRAAAVHSQILGPLSEAATADTLANRLLTVSDLDLAADIAASQEAYQR